MASYSDLESDAPSPTDPLAAVQALLAAAQGLADPQARAALLAGAQAAIAGLVAPPPAPAPLRIVDATPSRKAGSA